VAILSAAWIISGAKAIGPARRFDLIGFINFSFFLGFLLVALAQGQREGWDSDYIILCFSFSLLGLIAFISSAFWVQAPIIDLRLFANHNFLMANIINFVRAVAIFGSMFLLPFSCRISWTTRRSAPALSWPYGHQRSLVSPFSGIIADRIGPRIPLFCGTVLLAFSLYLYKDISLRSDYWFLSGPR